MKNRMSFVALPLLFALAAGPACASPGANCTMPAEGGIGAVYAELSRRAVEIVTKAASNGWKDDPSLRALVAPEATFGLGSGDVGRPLGTGLAGAHSLAGKILADEMKADSYRYITWSSIPREIDPCGEWGVKVEFIDSRSKSLANMEFNFRNGMLISAKGWMQWYAGGQLKSSQAN